MKTDTVVEHLAGMVRIPTLSDPDLTKMDFGPFFRLHLTPSLISLSQS